MRLSTVFALTAAGIIPSGAAYAGHHHGGDGAPEVHDHRSSGGSEHHDAPTVRDHRGESHSEPVVRDHRGGDYHPSGDNYGSTTYVEPTYVETYDQPTGPFDGYTGPAWTLELGGLAHRFRGPGFTRHGSVDNDGVMNSYTLASDSPTAGDTSAGAFDIRITVPTTQHLYLGGEVGIGGVMRSPVALMNGSSQLEIGSRTMVDSVFVAGTRARAGIAEIGAELAGGVRVLSTTVRPIDADLTQDDSPSSTESVVSPLLEARLRAALWVSPHVFFAGQVGVSALNHDDVNVGLAIGISSVPFAHHR